MRLSKEDVRLFYKLYHPLLLHVNKKARILKGLNSFDDLKKFSLEDANKLRDKLYSHPELIDSFVSENTSNFSSDELKIVSGWKNFVKGTFCIVRYLKDYTVFLHPTDPPKAYGVLALISTFEEMLGPDLPKMLEAVLLPFKDKITYDSIFLPYYIRFGRNMRRSLNEAYQEAKLRFGIITSLPFSPEKKEENDVERLRFYLRNKQSRERYWEKIEQLINKDERLRVLYYQEMGRIHAQKYRKRLRKLGLRSAWFAILEGIIIASGATKDGVERTLQDILPLEKRKFVYIFRLKEK